MTRLELANQVIEGQPAFHFAFIPKVNCELRIADFAFGGAEMCVNSRPANPKFEIRNPKFVWYRRRDSNPHCLVSKTSASFHLGYAGMQDRHSCLPISFSKNWDRQECLSYFGWWRRQDLNLRRR